ncbi:hypothetical protein MsAg5_03200 [Methanosarcinaceae archaeon Ag5]|uniref:Archaeal Type IV pilin N-terminal domain-containing protein n=1 Tax=Methanolapillus africanus TaxID=3028297 RepID=A0AAE4MIH9_9EURY|nr:hypothetical protein [Methanosarcinaceae archaeon Ag5]
MKNKDQIHRFNQGISPVISSLLLLLIVLLMCGAIFMNAAGWMESNDLTAVKPVKIELVDASCGNHADDNSRFQDNVLILKNVGGNPVPVGEISLKMTGKGDAYQGIPGSGGKMIIGDIEIRYEHLNVTDKNPNYQKQNAEMLKDGIWSPGEQLVLTGNDSKSSADSSVFVGVNGNFSTSNNYGLTAGETIDVVAFQSNQIVFKNTFSIPKK